MYCNYVTYGYTYVRVCAHVGLSVVRNLQRDNF